MFYSFLCFLVFPLSNIFLFVFSVSVRLFSSPSPSEAHYPHDPKTYPAVWADFRPDVCEIEASRNADGVLVGEVQGEKVVFPELEPTLEWVLTTPVELHLFEELPYVKLSPEEDGAH